jgi:hypothetical protein
MDEEPWHVRRRRELEAAGPTKRKRAEPFVKVPLWWIEAAAKATRSPATLVMIELLHVAWKAKSLTFPLPNGRLQRLSVSRETKRRVLRALEQGGLIRVARPPRKTPIVTLVSL